MFFVVDVETSGLTPWTGELLTVGIVPVMETGEIIDEDYLYIRLVHLAKNPIMITEAELTDTHKFWLDQDVEVRNEAFEQYPRHSFWDAREIISNYVKRMEPDASKRFIAANPVAFDKMWLEYLWSTDYESWPFHYRCLCLRSMRYGLEVDSVEYGSAKGNHESEVPHHGLHDAIAEAKDLQDMIYAKRSISASLDDFPNNEWGIENIARAHRNGL